MPSERPQLPDRGLLFGLSILTLGTAALLVVAFGSARINMASAQTTAEGSCGARATGWSTATVDGFQGTVREVAREPDHMGAETAAAERLVVTLAFANESSEVITLAEGTTVAVLTCDGDVLSPNAGGRVDPAALDMAPGAELEMTFTFIVPTGTEPERIVVRRTDGERCLGQLGFPLTIRDAAVVTPTAAGQPTPPAAEFASCDGGSATTGASTSGTSGSDGSTGSRSAEGTETPKVILRGNVSTSTTPDAAGSATGGRGCDGEDAVGAGATGGDGGDGGAAVSGANGGDVVGADCTPEADSSRPSAVTS